jgi:LysR family transcriptional regulator, transcriptional activator of nhaA
MLATLRRLNYQHLLYFWSVVRTGSLTRASEELALSAPTISAQLRTLDARLGEKLLVKSGRRLVPTEVGRVVFEYANEIFGLGQDLLETLEHRPTARPLRLAVGVDDVVPKEIAYRILEPTLHLKRPVRITCKEGTLERLVANLAVHELDVVLSDAPVTQSLAVKVHEHLLGGSDVVWMAKPALARILRKHFPASLNGAPMLLPTDDTAIRRTLDQWLVRKNVRPVLVAEFEDYAMLREFAKAGHVFTPVPTVMESQFRRQYGLARVGIAEGVTAQFYAISVERRIKHPAVAAMTAQAGKIFGAD